MPGESDMA